MRFTFNKYLAITVTLLCFSNTSFAGSVMSCETKATNIENNGGTATFDYGDATTNSDGTKSYSDACHRTNRWQQLGTTDGDALKGDTGTGSSKKGGWTNETTKNTVDEADNGVSWRVQNADGSWSAFGNEPLIAGAKAEFQFVVIRSDEGNHQFDQLKAWGDWNDNGKFDADEVIVDKKWYKVADSFAAGNTVGNKLGGYNNDWLVRNGADKYTIRNSGITSETLIVPILIPSEHVISSTWIRARIICENSLSGDDRRNNIFMATDYYHQGEVEDYKVAVNQVPEPTTLLVFGSALVGLMLSRKKSK